MNASDTTTVWINPVCLPLHDMTPASRISTIISSIQINDQGRHKTGKSPSDIAREFEPVLLTLSPQEKSQVRDSLATTPLINGTLEHVTAILER